MSAAGFGSTLGAIEIGVLISYFLLGLTTLQVYIYFSNFPNDSRSRKCLVLFVWCCELGHAICVGHALYTMTITYFAQPERLVRTPVSLGVAMLFGAFVPMCVQSFFAHRIYRLSDNSRIIPCLCWSLSLARLVATFVAAAVSLKPTFSSAQAEQQWGWLTVSIWSVGAANDAIIAGTLVYLYSHHRDEDLPKRALKIVDKLIVWTLETGAVTTIAGVITLISFLVNKQNYSWLAWWIATTRLFSNVLMASLNSRIALRAMTPSVLNLGRISHSISFRPSAISGNAETSKPSNTAA